MKAVIFNFEGTLLDLYDYQVRAYNKIMRDKFNLDFRKTDLEPRYGLLPKEIIQDFMERKGVKATLDYARLAEEKQDVLKNIVKGRVKVISGVKKLMKELKKEGFKVAIESSSKRADVEFMLKNSGLQKYFDAIAVGDDIKGGKPSSEAFLKAAAMLKIKPTECVVVGDSLYDAEAALKAKMKSIIVSKAKGEVKKKIMAKKPAFIVKKIKEIKVQEIKKL